VTDTIYDLFAVVIHKGTCYSGHYYGFIKDIDEIGNWLPPPSSLVTATTTKSPVVNRKSEESNENMKKVDLIKTLLLSNDDWVTTDDLLKVIEKQIFFLFLK